MGRAGEILKQLYESELKTLSDSELDFRIRLRLEALDRMDAWKRRERQMNERELSAYFLNHEDLAAAGLEKQRRECDV